VEVTPAGKEMYERIAAQRSAIISECVAGLSAEQEAVLIAALPAFEQLATELRATVRKSPTSSPATPQSPAD